MDGINLPFTRQGNQFFGSESSQVPFFEFFAFFAVDRKCRFFGLNGADEHLPIQKPQRIHGLVLRRGRHLPIDRQVGQKRLDLALSIGQILPAAHVVKVDLPLDPIRVAPFRVDRVMVQPHHVPNLVQ